MQLPVGVLTLRYNANRRTLCDLFANHLILANFPHPYAMTPICAKRHIKTQRQYHLLISPFIHSFIFHTLNPFPFGG